MPDDLRAQRMELGAEWDRIDEWAQAAERDGAYLPLLKLARLYDLSPFERNVLLLALAPELDRRYERCYAYIQDDVTRKRPAVDLALQLLCSTPHERLRARATFMPEAPLLRHHLIQLFEDGLRQPALLARFIKLDDRIVAELLGQPAGLKCRATTFRPRAAQPSKPCWRMRWRRSSPSWRIRPYSSPER